MKPKHTDLFLIGFFIMSIFYGCIKDEDFDFNRVTTGEWTPEWAVPLIHSSISINDFTGATDTGMFSTNNHQISLVYKTNIYSVYGYEFFTPVNQSHFQAIQIIPPDSATLYQNDSVSRGISFTMPLAFPNGEQIDSMTFRRGSLRINLSSDIPHDARLDISIPAATLNGQPFTKSVPISACAGSTNWVQDISDLSGYNMKTTINGNPNQLDISYNLTFLNSQTTSPCLNRNFGITTSFDSITPSNLFGFLGQREFIIPQDTCQIGIFNNFQGGGIYFENPKLTISLTNSFGMPIDAQLTTLSAVQADGSVVPINGPVPSPLIDYPLVYGQEATNSFYFDGTNSNIQTALNSNVKNFVFDITAGTNVPLPTYNFMSDSSVFKADLKVEVPLKGYTTGFAIQDTVDFAMEKIDEVTSASLRLNVTNGFPVSAFAQLYFTDENYNIIDSLFLNSQDRVIQSANVDANGKVTTPTYRMATENFDGVRLQHLFESKKILVTGIISTTDAPNISVAFYDDYKLDFKLGIKTKLKIKF